jgi:hypothetical protein
VTGETVRKVWTVALALAICTGCVARPVCAEILCADDIVPEGMAITATGTGASCDGACRARRTQAVCGPVMKICAGQPIPRGYVVDSVTSVPACRCLGPEENAYVIRYVGTRDETSLFPDSGSPADTPYVDSVDRDQDQDQATVSRERRYPYGNPPFGNLLCGTSAMEPNSNSTSTLPSQLNSANPNGTQPSFEGAPMPAPPSSSYYPPSWNSRQNEPFRVGQ